MSFFKKHRATSIVCALHVVFLFLLSESMPKKEKKNQPVKVTVHELQLNEKSPLLKESLAAQPPPPPPPAAPQAEAAAVEEESEAVAEREKSAPEPVHEEAPQVLAKTEAPKPTPKPVVKVESKKPATVTPKKKETKPKTQAPVAKKTDKKTVAKKAPAKKTTAKKPNPSPPPAKKNNELESKLAGMLKESLNSLEKGGKVGGVKGGVAGGEVGGTGKKIGALLSEGLSSDEGSTYAQEIALYLKHRLQLPEYGEVKIKLTLNANGKVSSVKITSSNSDKNRELVEKKVPTITFPPFDARLDGEKSHTFSVTLKSNA
jgi:colicin import membrane protein